MPIVDPLAPPTTPPVYSVPPTPGSSAPTLAPVTNPVGNGLANQPQLPPPATVGPTATYNAATATPGSTTSTPYTSSPYSVSDGGLVQKRVLDLVKDDSPLMMQSRRDAVGQMNERGLVNSSQAITAGQDAVIKSAMPIALADAQSINTADWKTSDAKNTASQFNAASDNAASSLNAQLTTSMNMNNANAQNNAMGANAQAQNVRNLALIDNNTKQALSVLDAQNRQLLQENANVSNMFQEVVKNIAAIAVNDTMSPAAKQAATQSQMNLLREGIATGGNVAGTVPGSIHELNLSQFFNTNPAAMTPEQKTAQRQQLQGAVDTAKAAIPIWGQNTGAYAVHDGKPQESERTSARFEQLLAAAKTQYQTAVNALNTFNTQAGT